MKKLLPLLLFAFAALSSVAQERTRSYLIDPALAPRDHNVQFTHMRLDISFTPEKSLVKGKVLLDFTALRASTDSIWLDGIRMRVQKITLNGKDAKYRPDTAGIMIYPPTALA